MRLVIDIGFSKDLTEKEMYMLDKMLRGAIPELVGWSYSPITRELVLDFGDSDENSILSRINTYLSKVGGRRIIRLELMDMVKEWQG